MIDLALVALLTAAFLYALWRDQRHHEHLRLLADFAAFFDEGNSAARALRKFGLSLEEAGEALERFSRTVRRSFE